METKFPVQKLIMPFKMKVQGSVLKKLTVTAILKKKFSITEFRKKSL